MDTTVGELSGGGGYRIIEGEYEGAEIFSILELPDDKVKLRMRLEGSVIEVVWAGTRRIVVQDEPFMGLT